MLLVLDDINRHIHSYLGPLGKTYLFITNHANHKRYGKPPYSLGDLYEDAIALDNVHLFVSLSQINKRNHLAIIAARYGSMNIIRQKIQVLQVIICQF